MEAKVRVLGVDYGQKFTGLAISKGGIAPRPLKVLRTERPWTKTASQVVTIAKEERVDAIVVAMPVYLDGDMRDRSTDSPHGRRSRNLAKYLAAGTKAEEIFVFLFDEYLTTQVADQALSGVYIEDGIDELYLSMEGMRSRSQKRRRRLKKKGVDAMAAAILLKRFFEAPGMAIEVKARADALFIVMGENGFEGFDILNCDRWNLCGDLVVDDASRSVALSDIPSLLSCVRDADHFDTAIAIYDWLVRNAIEIIDEKTFVVALECCLYTFGWRKALEINSAMKKLGVQLNLTGYNFLIATLGISGKAEEAFQVFGEMKGSSQRPNNFTIQFLLQACLRRTPVDYCKALDLYGLYKSTHSDDGQSLRDLALETCHVALRKCSLEDSFKVFEALHDHGLDDNVENYNTLLRACSKDSIKAVQILDHMEMSGIEPTVESYNTVIRSCAEGDQVLEAIKILDSMIKRYRSEGCEAAKPNLQSFELILKGCHLKVMPEKALDVLIAMIDFGFDLDESSIQELASTLSIAHVWDKKALRRRSQVNPDSLGLPIDQSIASIGDDRRSTT